MIILHTIPDKYMANHVVAIISIISVTYLLLGTLQVIQNERHYKRQRRKDYENDLLNINFNIAHSGGLLNPRDAYKKIKEKYPEYTKHLP